MKLTVSDVVSPSYFVATAAVELGYFKDEGVDVEFVHPPVDGGSKALRDGEVDFFGGSPYIALTAFPGWEGGKLLCALSQYNYWFLAIRSDIDARKGDVNAVKGLRISAAGNPGQALRRLLVAAGIDLERDNVRIVPPPPHSQTESWARQGVQAIEEGLAEAYWGNGMRAEYGVRLGIAKVLLDVRRGDGPPAARTYTFPALATSDRVIADHPEAAAGAVRAIVRTQRALKADPSLATKAAERLFPPEERALIADLVARDAPFYEATITPEAVAGVCQFAQDMGMLDRPVSYEQAVATQFAHLWNA